MNKEKLINKIENTYQDVVSLMENMREGDTTYSEAGEQYYDYLGDSITNVLENVLDYLKNKN